MSSFDVKRPYLQSTTTTRNEGEHTTELHRTIAHSRKPRSMDISSIKPRSLWRRVAGLFFLGVVIIAWTTSNFLNSSILANNQYSHPFFVVYISTSFFTIPLVPLALWRMWKGTLKSDEKSEPSETRQLSRTPSPRYSTFDDHQHQLPVGERLIDLQEGSSNNSGLTQQHLYLQDIENNAPAQPSLAPLTVKQTFKLSLKFCLLWLSANYFNTACLQYTTVASTTILASSSSVWTLIIGAVAGVEHLTSKKVFGVLQLLSGVAIIALMDIYTVHTDRGNFPDKTAGELALGDLMSLASAVIYGFYITQIAKAVGDQSRINMPLFFGFIGLVNILCAWPLFVVLDYTNVEKFALPPNKHIWIIIIANALISLISDVAWAIAVLLTSPLIVTVGLSLTIPLSLIGQVVLNGQQSGPFYWVGAALVVMAFVTVEQESRPSLDQQTQVSDDT